MGRAKTVRTVLLTTTAASFVAGSALAIAGKLENNEAKNTPGCNDYGGNTVFCNDEKSTKEANDKINSSLDKMKTGLIILGAGAGLALGTYLGHRHVEKLKKWGFLKGLQIGFNPANLEEIQVAYAYKF